MPDGELNEFQVKLALEQAEWRGSVTNEMKNFNKMQVAGFAAMEKRFDKLEKTYADDQENTEKKIGIIQRSIEKIKISNVKTATTVAFLTTLVLLILGKIFKVA